MNISINGYKKLLISLFITIILVLCGATSVMASGLGGTRLYDKAQERSLLDDLESVSDIQYTRVRNGHLNYGSIELIKVSPTRIRIGATTQAHHVCPEIWMDIYLDRYDPDTDAWSQIRYWEYSTTNSQHLTKNMEIIVLSGYYYSIRGYHSCIHGNVMETAETMTDGLYIGTTDKPIL